MYGLSMETTLVILAKPTIQRNKALIHNCGRNSFRVDILGSRLKEVALRVTCQVEKNSKLTHYYNMPKTFENPQENADGSFQRDGLHVLRRHLHWCEKWYVHSAGR